MPTPKKYPDELRERGVRLVFESGRPIAHLAEDLSVNRETLRLWVGRGRGRCRHAQRSTDQRRARTPQGARERGARSQEGQRDLEGRLGVFARSSIRPDRSEPIHLGAPRPGRGVPLRSNANPSTSLERHPRRDAPAAGRFHVGARRRDPQLIWTSLCQVPSTKGPRERAFLLLEEAAVRPECATRGQADMRGSGWPQDRVSSQRSRSRIERGRRSGCS
jgi:transposase